MTFLLVLIGIVLVGGYLIYVQLIKHKNTALEALSGVDVQLMKRHDLVPNLVASVKGYMTHEKDLLEEVTRLRQQAINTDAKAGPAEAASLFKTEMQLQLLMGRVLARVEAYPDLKASENMLHLQRELADIEDNISAARRFYNSACTDLKTAVETFPSSIIAGMVHIEQMPYFEADDASRAAVDLKGAF